MNNTSIQNKEVKKNIDEHDTKRFDDTKNQDLITQ